MNSKYFYYLFFSIFSFITIQMSFNIIEGQNIEKSSDINTTNIIIQVTNSTNNTLEYIGKNNIQESAKKYEEIQRLHSQSPETIIDLEAFEDKNISKLKENIEKSDIFLADSFNAPGKILVFNARAVLDSNLTHFTIINSNSSLISNSDSHINKSQVVQLHDPIKTQYTIKKWEGLNYNTAAVVNDEKGNKTQGFIPPDVALAVGPEHVLQMVHSALRIWDKSGVEKETVFLSDFFNIKNPYQFTDPVILYDNVTKKWFGVIIEDSPRFNSKGEEKESCQFDCFLKVAVSQEDDPTKPWNLYRIPFEKKFPDYPKIGTSMNKFAIGIDIFENKGEFIGTQVLIIDKNTIIKNSTDLSTYRSPIFEDYDYEGIVPVTSDTDCLYMEGINWPGDVEEIDTIVLFEACGNLSINNNINLNLKDIYTQPILLPVNAIQPNKIKHDTGEFSIQSPVYFNNTIINAITYSCDNMGDPKTCIGLLKINNINQSDPFVDFVGISSDDNHYIFYPAISMNKDGNIVMIYGISSSETYPSLLVMILDKDFNMLQNSLLVKGDGNTNNQTKDKKGEEKETAERFGDYFTAATDPIDGSVWVTGEYGNKTIENAWSTYVGNVS